MTLANGFHPFLMLRHHREQLKLFDFNMGMRVEYRFSPGTPWILSHPDAVIRLEGRTSIELRIIGAPSDLDGVARAPRTATACERTSFDSGLSVDDLWTTSKWEGSINLFEDLPFTRSLTPCLIFYGLGATVEKDGMATTPVCPTCFSASLVQLTFSIHRSLYRRSQVDNMSPKNS